MLLRTKQQTCSRKVVKLKRFYSQEEDLFSVRKQYFFLLCLVISKHEFVNKSFQVSGGKLRFLEVLF